MDPDFVTAIVAVIAGWFVARHYYLKQSKQVDSHHDEYIELINNLQKLIEGRKTVTLSEAFLLTRELAARVEERRGERRIKVILAISPGGGMIAEWLSRTFLGGFEEPIPVYTIPMHVVEDGGAGVHQASDRRGFLIEYLLEHLQLGTDDIILMVNDHSRSGRTWRQAIDSLGDAVLARESDGKAKHYEIENGPGIICSSIFCAPGSEFYTDPFVLEGAADGLMFEWKDNLDDPANRRLADNADHQEP